MSLRAWAAGRFAGVTRETWLAIGGLGLALAVVGSVIVIGVTRPKGGVASASPSAVAAASASQAIVTASPTPEAASSPTFLLGFNRAASMTVPRSGHTAVRLNDGRVLITDGRDGTAELFDPKTGKFAVTGSMKVARSGYTTTVLTDGRVLIAGGSIGGTATLDSAELYDPATGTFTATVRWVGRVPATPPRC